MGRKPTPNAAARARARELSSGGHTVRSIAEMLAKEGHAVSKSTVSNWLRPAAKRARKTTAAKGAAATGQPTGQAAPEAPAPTAEPDALAVLQSAVQDLAALAAVAKESKALPAFSTIQRTLNQTIALAERLKPPPAPDPNADPDVVVTAKACRAKLHELLDVALGAQNEGAA